MYWCHWAVVRVLVVVHIRRVASSMLRFHSQIVRSSLAAARAFPSGLNATEVTLAAAAVRGGPSGAGRAGGVRFHSQTGPSRVPAAKMCPSGLNATVLTALRGPVRGWAGRVPQEHSVVAAAAAGGEGFAVRAERH